LLGLAEAGDAVDLDAPLTIGACDNGAVFDAEALRAALDDADTDLLVWAARGYPGARKCPTHYGWIDAVDGEVRGVSVKTPLSDPWHDPIVVGTFTFRRARDFIAAAEATIARDGRINGEFYVDSCVQDALALGLRCRLFEIEHYLCWGTPDDLRTFEYWQRCFDRWPAHPYRVKLDSRVAGAFAGAASSPGSAHDPPQASASGHTPSTRIQPA
jgi:hypothetical protein